MRRPHTFVLPAVLRCSVLVGRASAQVRWRKEPGNPSVPRGVGAGYALNPSVLRVR